MAEQSEGAVDLSLKRNCRHAEKVRTSMEAVGVDVFATVRKLSLPIEVIPCENNAYGKITHTDLTRMGCSSLLMRKWACRVSPASDSKLGSIDVATVTALARQSQ